MNRKISALGLALLAALAFGALAAQAASAATDHITATKEWTPTVSAKTTQVFRATTDKENPRFECTTISATSTGLIGTTVEEIAVTPTYENCTGFNRGGTKATAFVENGGCEYVFQGVTTAGNPTGGEHANVLIRNHENTEGTCHIQIKATAFKFPCASVPNQDVEHAVRYTSGADEDIVISATAHGITNTTTNSIACPTETGGTETHHDGSYTGDVTVKGHDNSTANVPLSVSTT
jgi:hypothetical protein